MLLFYIYKQSDQQMRGLTVSYIPLYFSVLCPTYVGKYLTLRICAIRPEDRRKIFNIIISKEIVTLSLTNLAMQKPRLTSFF